MRSVGQAWERECGWDHDVCVPVWEKSKVRKVSGDPERVQAREPGGRSVSGGRK